MKTTILESKCFKTAGVSAQEWWEEISDENVNFDDEYFPYNNKALHIAVSLLD